MPLYDSTIHCVTRIYYFTATCYAKTLSPYTRLQFPNLHRHEIIEFYINTPSPTLVSPINVQFFSRQPFPILHLGPITTFGPITQF